MGICRFLRKKWVYAALGICSFEKFLRWVYAVFQDIIYVLLDSVVSEKIRNDRKLDLVMKNSVWQRLRRAKEEIQVKTRF